LAVIVGTLDQGPRGGNLSSFGFGQTAGEHGEALGRLHRCRRTGRNRLRPFLGLGGGIVHHGVEQAPAQALLGGNIAGQQQHFQRTGARHDLGQAQRAHR
jgi:hypothetical protein